MYSAWPRLVDLARYTAARWSRVRRPISAVNKKPAAECEIQTTVQQLLIARPDNHWFQDFSLPHLHSTLPLGRFPSEYCHPVWCRKTRMVWLPDGEKNWRYLYSFRHNVRTWQTNTHTHTDTAWRHRPRLCIASRGKNATGTKSIHVYFRQNSIVKI